MLSDRIYDQFDIVASCVGDLDGVPYIGDLVGVLGQRVNKK